MIGAIQNEWPTGKTGPFAGARTREGKEMHDQQVKEAVCRRIAEGESLSLISVGVDAPSKSTVARWLHDDPAFLGAYMAARSIQSHALADEILEIAETAVDKDSAAAARVKIDARFRLMEKFAPKIYGAAVQLRHADASGNDLRTLSDIERAERLAGIVDRLSQGA